MQVWEIFLPFLTEWICIYTYIRSYQTREQEANEAIERKRQAILAQRKAATVQATMRFQRNLPGFTVMGKFSYCYEFK